MKIFLLALVATVLVVIVANCPLAFIVIAGVVALFVDMEERR